eukprot:5955649-Prymnesium_polylepis.1
MACKKARATRARTGGQVLDVDVLPGDQHVADGEARVADGACGLAVAAEPERVAVVEDDRQ